MRVALYILLVLGLVAVFWPADHHAQADMLLLVGSRNSYIYHFDTCDAAKRIKPENMIMFPTPEKAKAAGYRPCRICNPPEATTKVKEA